MIKTSKMVETNKFQIMVTKERFNSGTNTKIIINNMGGGEARLRLEMVIEEGRKIVFSGPLSSGVTNLELSLNEAEWCSSTESVILKGYVGTNLMTSKKQILKLEISISPGTIEEPVRLTPTNNIYIFIEPCLKK